MAQKRMFNNLVIGSDDFLEMPDSSQNLYFHLSMNADDDGFVDKWKSIMRMTGKKEDDLKILITKSFVIPFESGLIVIRHWKLNNYIQKDRYKETIHKEEKALLTLDENNVYNMYTDCTQNVSLDKNRLDKSSIDKKRGGFAKPTLEEIKAYVIDKGYHFDPEAFLAYYESNGWKVGKNPMKSWKDACTTWEKREGGSASKSKKLSDMSNDQVTPLSAEERQRLKGAIKR